MPFEHGTVSTCASYTRTICMSSRIPDHARAAPVPCCIYGNEIEPPEGALAFLAVAQVSRCCNEMVGQIVVNKGIVAQCLAGAPHLLRAIRRP